MTTRPLGLAGRVAAAFVDSKLTPLVIVASIGLGVLAVLASFVNPYGWNAFVPPFRVLGAALPMITEWAPSDFSRLGPFELVLLAAAGLGGSAGCT